MDYQEQIANTAEFDLVVCILWSRLGALPVPILKMPEAPKVRNICSLGLAPQGFEKETPAV